MLAMAASPVHIVDRHVRQHAAPGLTQRKRGELTELAGRWHAARDAYIAMYSDTSCLSKVMGSTHGLREEQRVRGWAPVELTVHYHQTAFISAIQLLRSEWSIAVSAVLRRVANDETLGRRDAEWLQVALPDVAELQAAIDAGAQGTTLQRRITRMLLRSRPRRVRARSRMWFEVDGQLYRPFTRMTDRFYRGAWVALTGLAPGRRICVPLSGRQNGLFAPRSGRKTSPNLRVVIGTRVSFHGRERLEITRRSGGSECGVDKGIRALLTVSDGDAASAHTYGADAGERAREIAATAEDGLRGRRALAAFQRLVGTTDPGKARRIARNNLGRKRIAARAMRQRRSVEGLIGAAVNTLFKERPYLARVHVESLHWAGAPSPWRNINRLLGRWMKGYLQRRLAFKAGLNGVELNVVNAAYTSQTCPRCWFVSRENRRDERFECTDCGYAGSSDAVAATNVLRRGSDPAITRYMSPGDVRRILEERWRSARTGRAWGSNEGIPREDTRAEHDPGQSREQRSLGSALHQQPRSPALSTSSGLESLESSSGALSSAG